MEASVIKTSHHFCKCYFRLANVSVSGEGGRVPAQMSYSRTGANVYPRCVGVLSYIT